jgi:uncharacterized HAD superfamily protein
LSAVAIDSPAQSTNNVAIKPVHGHLSDQPTFIEELARRFLKQISEDNPTSIAEFMSQCGRPKFDEWLRQIAT